MTILLPLSIDNVKATYLEHSLLVFAVLHLSRGEVEDSPFHRVLVTVVDEDVGPPHHHKVLHPRVGARLHEAQETLLGDDRPWGESVEGGMDQEKSSGANNHKHKVFLPLSLSFQMDGLLILIQLLRGCNATHPGLISSISGTRFRNSFFPARAR